MISFKFKSLHFEGEELGDVCAPDSVPVLFGPARTPQENRQGREASPGRRSCVGRRGSFAVGHFGAGARIKPLRRASTYADSPGIYHPIIGTQITQVVSLTNLMNRTSQGPRNIVGLCCCTRVLPRFEASSYKSTEARRSEIWWERARRTFPNV